VRWDNLTTAADDEARLPGHRDPATIRRFDAPEALDMRFYEIQAKSAINRVPSASQMPFRWTINPYRGCSHACLYCFARPTHKYLDFDAGRDFEREIVVKVNAPEVVRAELRRPSWKGEHVAMGTNTDPYQWVESRYKLMPGIWEAFRDARNPCSILTKSPLLLRDIELMKEIAAVTQIHANLSIPTLDAKAWRATEPHTPHPRARLEAVAELNRAGIPTGVLIAPLMPGINDAPEQVEPLLEAAAAAGATGIGGIALHLRGDVRKLFFDWLRAHRRELLPLYEKLYARGAYAPVGERRRLAALVRRDETSWPSRFEPPAQPRRDTVEGAEAQARDAQTTLF
jgi:DNA repair photolyase